MSFDVYQNLASDGVTKIEIFVEKSIIVETGADYIVDWRTKANDPSSKDYDIFTAIGDFMTIQGGLSLDLSTTFTEVKGTGLEELKPGQTGGAVAFGNADANQVKGTDGRDSVDAGAGDDTLDGGKGADRLTGGKGDDIIKGGEDGDKYGTKQDGSPDLNNPKQVWEWGDRATYKYKKSDYEIIKTGTNTFTVEHKASMVLLLKKLMQL